MTEKKAIFIIVLGTTFLLVLLFGSKTNIVIGIVENVREGTEFDHNNVTGGAVGYMTHGIKGGIVGWAVSKSRPKRVCEFSVRVPNEKRFHFVFQNVGLNDCLLLRNGMKIGIEEITFGKFVLGYYKFGVGGAREY